jgi:serine/threonine-protein kinase
MVVAARHVELGQLVAIKLMLPTALNGSEARRRFLREARAAVRLKSEHVARVFDVGSMEDGCPYIVMEHLEGRDLGAIVQMRGALPIGEAVDYALQACEALAEAHAAGIIHRDIKPSNLFLARGAAGKAARLKILDFGISKSNALGDPDGAVTQSNWMMGSPRYMSPEQMQSTRDVDARSDVWSLGVTLYELVTATLPFPGDTAGQVFARVFAGNPTPMRTLRDDVPEGLDEIVMACLVRDREARIPDVGALAEKLAKYADAAGASSAQRVIIALRASSTNAITDPMASDPTESGGDFPGASGPELVAQGATGTPWTGAVPTRTRSMRWIVALSLAAAAAVGAVLLITRGDPKPQSVEVKSAATVPSSTTSTTSSNAPSSPPPIETAAMIAATSATSTTSAAIAPPSTTTTTTSVPKTPAIAPKKPILPAMPSVAPTPTSSGPGWLDGRK